MGNGVSLPLVKKILVLRLSSLGDVVLATSALAPLHRAGYEIHFCTKSAFAPLLHKDPRIRRVYEFQKNPLGEAKSREAFLRWVEEENFSGVLDLHDSLRTRQWRRHFRMPVVVAEKERVREWRILFLRERSLGFGRGGRARKMRAAAFSLLRKLGNEPQEENTPLTELFVGPEEKEVLKRRFSLPESFVVLLPGSAWEGKRWQGYASLAAKLAEPVVILGGKEDEKEAVTILRQAAKGSLSLAGRASLRESLVTLSLAAKAIGNDTGMTHAAQALGIPVVMVEGPTEESLGFSLHSQKAELVGLDLWCRPCSKTGRFCWRGGSRLCLKGISAEKVLEALAKL